MILTNVVEERWVQTSDYSTTTDEKLLVRRKLSQAMITGASIQKIEMDRSIYDFVLGSVNEGVE